MTPDQGIQFIPLNRLIPSPRNVRRKDRKAGIEALAASIGSRGLLQNLCVVRAGDDRYEVDAGGRRLAALKLLAKAGTIAKDWPVPCNVVTLEAGREVSLAENVHRVAMDAMDEVDAFAALVADGVAAEEIARRFGVTRRHVDQRLALAGLSPKIKAAWKRGDVTLEAARAFCLVDDHARQDAVFRSLGRPVSNPSSVRARLMDGRVRSSDRLALYVGLAAYEAAGGKLVRDLFDAEAVFIDDPALLASLAETKLEGLRTRLIAEGWSWAGINLAGNRSEGLSVMRLHPEWRDPTPEEQVELDRLLCEIEALDTALEADSVEDDPRWSVRDDLEAAWETIRQAGRCWTPDQKALGGAVLGVGHDGCVTITEGVVRTADEKRVKAYQAQRRALEACGQTDRGHDHDAPAASRVSALPRAVNRDLTRVRTRALRLGLSRDPDTALAFCVAALARRVLHHADITGVSLAAQARDVDDLPGFGEALQALSVPEDESGLVAWALDLARERLLKVLAVLVASTLDLTHEGASPADLRRQALADCLAQQLDLDMKEVWRPDLDFWVRLPKAALLAALAESPGMEDRSQRTRDDLLKSYAKLCKDDLAAKAAAIFEGAGYLPEILVTPQPAGAFALGEGQAALAASSETAA